MLVWNRPIARLLVQVLTAVSEGMVVQITPNSTKQHTQHVCVCVCVDQMGGS